jgi:hypothetical protein
MKTVANEIFGIFEKYKAGNCTYDRALEDASIVMDKYAEEKPIVGYVKSGTVRDILSKVYHNSKVDKEKSYQFIAELHTNDIDTIKRILNSK